MVNVYVEQESVWSSLVDQLGVVAVVVPEDEVISVILVVNLDTPPENVEVAGDLVDHVDVLDLDPNQEIEKNQNDHAPGHDHEVDLETDHQGETKIDLGPDLGKDAHNPKKSGHLPKKDVRHREINDLLPEISVLHQEIKNRVHVQKSKSLRLALVLALDHLQSPRTENHVKEKRHRDLAADRNRLRQDMTKKVIATTGTVFANDATVTMTGEIVTTNTVEQPTRCSPIVKNTTLIGLF